MSIIAFVNRPALLSRGERCLPVYESSLVDDRCPRRTDPHSNLTWQRPLTSSLHDFSLSVNGSSAMRRMAWLFCLVGGIALRTSRREEVVRRNMLGRPTPCRAARRAEQCPNANVHPRAFAVDDLIPDRTSSECTRLLSSAGLVEERPESSPSDA